MHDVLDAVSNNPKINSKPVQRLYTEDDILSDLWRKKLSGRPLRDIAKDYPGITYGDIHRALRGNFPKSIDKRHAFGLLASAITTVTIMLDEPIPDGAQVLTATRCECGRWYVSNCPARRKCFICRPYGGKR